MRRLVLSSFLIAIIIALGFRGASAQMPVVKLGSFDKPSFGHVTGSLIEAKGFDKKNGIDLQWDFKGGKAANTDYATGRDKVTHASALLPEANRRLKGVKTRILFHVVNLHGAFLTEDPTVRSVKDLEGKSVAAFTITSSFAMAKWFMMRAGVDLSKVEILSTNTAGLATYLLAKRADAVWLWEPNYSKILVDHPGRFKMLEVVHQWQAIYGRSFRGHLSVSAHADWIEANKNKIPKIYKAFKDLADWLPTHHEEAATIINKAAGIPRKAFLMALKTNRYYLDVVPAGSIREDIQLVFKAGVESGYMKKMPDNGIIYSGLKE
ncbi:MAG: ABC transporter substrate-binding protein [Candidatus Binatia bacterium]